MAITIGDMLGGIGAAFGGTSQQYAQGLRQREQGITEQKRAELIARQQAMYQDAGAAFQLLQQGDLDGIISLADDRLELLGTFPDADPSDTMQIRDLAVAARQGDPIALRELATSLTSATSAGYASGILQRPAVDSVVVDGRLVNRSTGDVIYEPTGDSQPTGSFGLTPSYLQDAEGNIRLAQLSSAGGIQVIEPPEGMTPIRPASQLAYDPAAIAQRGAAQTAVNVADIIATTDPTAARSAAERRAIAQVDRSQDAINSGLEAAETVPTLLRSLELLESVKTGGFAAAAIRARSLFGIESPDEGELSYNLARNVLQQLKPTFGAAFTAAEGQRLESIEAGLGRNTETNIRILNRVLDAARKETQRAYDRAFAEGDTRTANDLQMAIDSINAIAAPSIPPQFEGLVSPEDWRQMTKEERALFSEGR